MVISYETTPNVFYFRLHWYYIGTLFCQFECRWGNKNILERFDHTELPQLLTLLYARFILSTTNSEKITPVADNIHTALYQRRNRGLYPPSKGAISVSWYSLHAHAFLCLICWCLFVFLPASSSVTLLFRLFQINSARSNKLSRDIFGLEFLLFDNGIWCCQTFVNSYCYHLYRVSNTH